MRTDNSPEQYEDKNGLEVKQVKKYFFVIRTLQKI